MRFYLQNNLKKAKRAECVAQVVKYFPSMHEALCSTPSITSNNKKEIIMTFNGFGRYSLAYLEKEYFCLTLNTIHHAKGEREKVRQREERRGKKRRG
jgi:hypothetical protein